MGVGGGGKVRNCCCTFDVPWTDSFQVEHSRVSMRLTSNSVASRTSHVQRLLPVVFFFFFLVVVAAPSSTVFPVNSNYGTDVTSLRPSYWPVLGFFDQSHLCVYNKIDPIEYDYSALSMFFETTSSSTFYSYSLNNKVECPKSGPSRRCTSTYYEI